MNLQPFAWVRPDFNDILYRKNGNNSGTLPKGITDKHSIIIFPNPNNGNFTARCEKGGVLSIYNVQGIEIARLDMKEGTNNVNLQNVAAGVYFATLRSHVNKEATTVRLILKP